MSAFLFCSLDSPGFLYPMVGMAKVLKSRGHEVSFVTDIQLTQFLAHLDLSRIPRTLQDGSSFNTAQWHHLYSIVIQVKHIEYALERFRADILVGSSLALGPLIVSDRRKLPVALLGFCTYLWPVLDSPLPEQGHSEIEKRLAWRHDDMLKRLNQVRQLFRLKPHVCGSRNTPLLGDLFMVRSVPELEHGSQYPLPERVHLVGSCLWEPEELDSELERWLEDTKISGLPLIYIQHGRFFSTPSFWPALVEALGGWKYRVAASTGRFDGEIGNVPENFFVRPHLPQNRLLKAAQAVIASANTTVVLGAFTAGLPMLLIPAGGEQPDVAELCNRVGVARILSTNEVTPDKINQGIEVILEGPGFQDRAHYYKSAFSRVEGSRKAADLLELLADTKQPVLSHTTVPRRSNAKENKPWKKSAKKFKA